MIDDDRRDDGYPPGTQDDGLPRITVAGAVLQLGNRYPVRGASLTVRSGEIVGLVGAPGSGRSSLLYLVSGLHTPAYGVVRVCGRSADRYREQSAGAVPTLLSARDLIDNPPVMAVADAGYPLPVVPPVVLMDEPTAGRPGADRRRIWRSLATARRLGAAVLVALDGSDLYDAECDRAYLMVGGATVASGTLSGAMGALRAGREIEEAVLAALR